MTAHDRIPTIAERVDELLEGVPPLTDEEARRMAVLYLAAKRSVLEASKSDVA